LGDGGCEGRGFGEGVEVADCGVEGCVLLDARDWVAFEAGLVEEHVDYLVYYRVLSAFPGALSFKLLYIHYFGSDVGFRYKCIGRDGYK